MLLSISRLLILALIALPTLAQTPAALNEFRADAIRAHVKFLSSDLLEGRGPGTRGDALTTTYIATQFEAMGIPPAGDNGTYFQKVSLLGLTTDGDKSRLAFTKNGAPVLG